MADSHINYFKISLVRAQIGNHVNLSRVKFGNPSLNLGVDAQIFADKNISIGKVESLQLKETHRQGEYLFLTRNPKWDFIKVLDKHLESKLHLQLNLSIEKRKNISESLIFDFLVNRDMEKQHKLINLPIKLQPITFPFDQFRRQPYKLHSVKVDFKIPQEKNQNETKQTAKTDGTIIIQLSFLEDLKSEFRIKNLCLETQQFLKLYRMSVFQVNTNRKTLKTNRFLRIPTEAKDIKFIQKIYQNKTGRQLHSQTKSALKLTQLQLYPHQWGKFRMNEISDSPVSIPLQILNEEDQLIIAFDFDIIQKISQSKSKQGTIESNDGYFKPGKQGSKNPKTKKGVENNERMSKAAKQETFQVKIRHATAQNLIRIEDLISKKQMSQKWTKQTIEMNHQTQKYTLEFEYMISVKRGNAFNSIPESRDSQALQQTIIQKTIQQESERYQPIESIESVEFFEGISKDQSKSKLEKNKTEQQKQEEMQEKKEKKRKKENTQSLNVFEFFTNAH